MGIIDKIIFNVKGFYKKIKNFSILGKIMKISIKRIVMKVLLAPSEMKKKGGTFAFAPQTLLFTALLPHRLQLLHAYTNLLQQGDLNTLSKLFGLKKESEIKSYIKDIIHQPTMKAIERYSGVAFEYLDYEGLDTKAQNYIDNNVILFSNLFGPIRASDFVPDYKLKQAEAVLEIKPEKFYHEHASELVEEYLKEEEILDLRATFYNKFYRPTKPCTTLKFIKNNKVVSHWAKAYRGIVLREIAKANIQSIEALIAYSFEGLKLQEIKQYKNSSELIYAIG